MCIIPNGIIIVDWHRQLEANYLTYRTFECDYQRLGTVRRKERWEKVADQRIN